MKLFEINLVSFRANKSCLFPKLVSCPGLFYHFIQQDCSKKCFLTSIFCKYKIHTIFGQITTCNFTSDNRQQEVSMYYHLVLQQIYVVNTVQKIHLISVSSLYQQITSLFCPVCSHDKSFYSFL